MATPEEIRERILDTSQIVENTLKSVAAQISDIFQDALSEADTITKIFGKDVEKQLRSLARSTDKMIENQLKINAGQASSKDISKQILEYNTKREVLEKRIRNLMQDQPALANQLMQQLADVDAANLDYIEGLKEQEEELKKIEQRMGVLGKLASGLNKIPILGNLIDAKEIETQMKKTAATTESKIAVLAAGFKTIGSSLKKGLTDPLTLIIFFTTKALEANKQTVELGKALGYAGTKADSYRESLAQIARSSTNIFVTTTNLAEAFNELSQATGFAYEFTADQLETQIKLTKQVGLQAEESAQIQRLAVLNGKTSEATYESFIRGLTATRNQLKVGINFKATLAEALKVSGQLAANLGYNPERIAKAIVTAKAFGTTLEQIVRTGEQLLNFESSLESELKAELLTGRQLNLERARAAALVGDQVALAEELNKNIGTSAEFTKMNVLQQRALAESVGMTADELAETLRRREEALASGKSLAQVTEEEAAKALERNNIQDKFNQAILKLQDFFGNLIAGPLGTILDILTDALSIVTLIALPFSAIYELTSMIGNGIGGWLDGLGLAGKLIKGIASAAIIYAAYTAYAAVSTALAATIIGGFIAPIAGAAAAAAVTAAGFGLLNSRKGDDVMSEGGYGKRTLLMPEGAIKLNNKDTVITGTNLFEPKPTPSLRPPTKTKSESISPSIDFTPMTAAINEVKNAINEVKAATDKLYTKDTSINMDGKRVGTTLTQRSYRVA